jgi:ubiquinone/menaquinone biosynthesis C-methylase UbiE
MSICARTDERNWKVYKKGCDASKEEKAKALKEEFIKPGVILDLGSGTLVIAKILSELYSDRNPSEKIRLVGVDISPEMMQTAKTRKKECEGISIDLIRNDITKLCIADESIDTVLCFSFLHEIYSDCGLTASTDALRGIYRMLKHGGRLIIRDGPRPYEKRRAYLKFNKKETEELFYKFAQDFDPHNFVEAYIPKRKPKYNIHFKKLDNGMISLNEAECFEFLTKYIYKENWPVEVKERFGVFTPEQWKTILEFFGFKVYPIETHLIPYLENRWKTDGIELYKRVNNGYVQTNYPDSTMILVAEKVRI